MKLTSDERAFFDYFETAMDYNLIVTEEEIKRYTELLKKITKSKSLN